MSEPSTTRLITYEELAKHNSRQDAWLAVRGKVFNVTDYISQHPGGVAPISKGFGKDATSLFDSVHPYVDFDKILKGKQMGILEKSTQSSSKAAGGSGGLKGGSTSTTTGCCCFRSKSRSIATNVLEFVEDDFKIFIEVSTIKPECDENDWSVSVTDKNLLLIKNFQNSALVWLANYTLAYPLIDDTVSTVFANHYSKMTVQLLKPDQGVRWKSLGVPTDDNDSIVDSLNAPKDMVAGTIIAKKSLTSDVVMFSIELHPSMRLGIPIGFHIKLKIGSEKESVQTLNLMMEKNAGKSSNSSTNNSSSRAPPTPGSSQNMLGADLRPPSVPPLNKIKKNEMVKKGKSMVEWMQQKDKLLGNKIRKLRDIGLDELAAHASPDDLWMALKGKVYDVTAYLGYHPGGVDELIRGAGIDATSLFNSIHAWVNFEPILSGSQVGFLVRRDTLMGPPVPVASLPTTLTVFSPPVMNFSEDDSHVFCQIDSTSDENYTEDWWTVGILGRERMLLKVLIKPPDLWMAHLRLVESLRDDSVNLRFQNNFKSLILSLQKPDKGKWKMLGAPLVQNGEILKSYKAIQDMHFCSIISKEFITHNVVFLTVGVNKSSHIGVPVGFHVKLRIKEKYRRYTPLCCSILNEKKNTNETTYQKLYFIIKIYEDGQFTQILNKIPVVETSTVFNADNTHQNDERALEVGCSSGNFELDFLSTTDFLLMLAAGSGITPCVRILKYVIENKEILFSRTRVMLIFFNQEEKDIIWRREWESVVEAHPWFSFLPVLSKAHDDWKGLRGRINANLLTQCLKTLTSKVLNEPTVNKKSVICGSHGFNKISKSSLLEILEMKMTDKDIYVFAG